MLLICMFSGITFLYKTFISNIYVFSFGISSIDVATTEAV